MSKEIDFESLTPSQYVVTSSQAMRRVVRWRDYDVLMVRGCQPKVSAHVFAPEAQRKLAGDEGFAKSLER